jgi:hypothetical protein
MIRPMTGASPTPAAERGPEWAELGVLIRQTAGMFGTPGEIAEERAAPRQVVRLLSLWLGALEAMARALLVRLALGLPRPASPRSRMRSTDAHRAGAGREPPPGGDAILESERWAGVWFTGVPRRPSADGQGSGRADAKAPVSTGGAPRLAWTAPVARRFEALIRVAEAPERYARRIARRLAIDKQAARRILRPPPRGGPAALERDAAVRAQDQAWMDLESLGVDTG